MTPTATAVCLALLASPLLPLASATESNVQCTHAQVDHRFLERELDYGTPNAQQGLLPGVWEHASVQFVAYLPCMQMANVFACILNFATCTDEELEWVERGMDYVQDRLSNVALRADGCPPLMTDYEVLVTYNTKGIAADPSLQPLVACVDSPAALPKLPSL